MSTIEPAKAHVELEHPHARPLTACHWDPLGRYVFFGAEDYGVHRFDVATKTAVPLMAHDSWVRGLGCSPSGEQLYSGGYDGRLVWWPAAAEKPEPIRVVDAHRGWIRELAVSPVGELVASCGNDNLVKLWNATDGSQVHEFSGHESHVYNVAFSPNGESLVSCDLHGKLKAWDLKSGKLQRDLGAAEALYLYDKSFLADIGGARCMNFRSDGNQVAVGGITKVTNAFAGIGEAVVVLVEAESGKVARQLEAKEKVHGTTWGIAHHSQGLWVGVAGGGGGGWLYFWNEEGEPQEIFKLKLKSPGRGMSLAADGLRVAVAHSDNHLRIYSLV
ncbi:WD40 repeat domain-containing protein [Candidatus Laterigemmans baculatus]|uniref:WD40 repeat domain-containing protein n=1 Tax=Candidatus Laterigemmans baculatus TaxID=2770505 RepID=UPI0013DD40EA|nr:hypothetical protein [Candidatus Laterigemmans baculatus]